MLANSVLTQFLKSITLIGCLSTVLFLLFVKLQAQVSIPPTVVTAVAPGFDGFDAGRELVNSINVEVKINASGDVTTVKTVSFTLFSAIEAETAAKQWKFAAAGNGAQERTAQLTFVFRMMPKETPFERLTPIFTPPYEIEVRHEDIRPIRIMDPRVLPEKHGIHKLLRKLLSVWM